MLFQGIFLAAEGNHGQDEPYIGDHTMFRDPQQ